MKCIAPWIWHKKGHNQDLVQTVHSFEMLVTAMYRNDGKNIEMQWPGATHSSKYKNPTERNNVLHFPGITSRFVDRDGTVVNQHEKPPQLLFEFCDRFLPRSTNLLIVGAGSGGDVIGGLKSLAGDIIALEPDPYQFEELVRRIRTLHSADEKSHNKDYEYLLPEFKFLADTNVEEDETPVEEVEERCVACDNVFGEDKVDACAACGKKFCADEGSEGERCYSEKEGTKYCCPKCFPIVIVEESQVVEESA